MKRILLAAICAVMVITTASCGKNRVKDISEIERISPDNLITAESVSAITGVTMKIDDNGVTNDGSARSVTYVPSPVGSADPVTIRIEQFSETLTTSQVWADYENSRIRRKDMEFIEGIGQDCYIAYPYINVYDRGCFIRISAGSGDNDEQKELLMSLASAAAVEVETIIPAETVEAASSNVIK